MISHSPDDVFNADSSVLEIIKAPKQEEHRSEGLPFYHRHKYLEKIRFTSTFFLISVDFFFIPIDSETMLERASSVLSFILFTLPIF